MDYSLAIVNAIALAVVHTSEGHESNDMRCTTGTMSDPGCTSCRIELIGGTAMCGLSERENERHHKVFSTSSTFAFIQFSEQYHSLLYHSWTQSSSASHLVVVHYQLEPSPAPLDSKSLIGPHTDN